MAEGSGGLYQKCERIIRGWNGWSRAERARMDNLVEEIMLHTLDGGGNRFVREWVKRVLAPQLPEMFTGRQTKEGGQE